MRTAQLHDEVCRALEAAGGTPPEPLLPAGYGGRRADIVFPNEAAIVEVKTLGADRVRSDDIREKVVEILMKWARRGRAPVIFGDVSISLNDLERPVAEEITALFGKRIRREISHANAQLKEMAAQLALPDAFGLLIIAVPAHYETHAGLVARSAHDALRSAQNSSVHGLITIMAPVDDRPRGMDPGPLVIVQHTRGGRDFPGGLYRRIAEAWSAHFFRSHGVEPPPLEPATMEDFMEKFMGPPLEDE